MPVLKCQQHQPSLPMSAALCKPFRVGAHTACPPSSGRAASDEGRRSLGHARPAGLQLPLGAAGRHPEAAACALPPSVPADGGGGGGGHRPG